MIEQKTSDIPFLFFNFGLNQQFFEYSCKEGNSQSFIDNIFCDIGKDTLTATTLCNAISDHEAQLLCCSFDLVNVTTETKVKYRKRMFSDEDINYFNFFRHGEDWQKIYAESDANFAFQMFFDIFFMAFLIWLFPL